MSTVEANTETLAGLLGRVAEGDHQAFSALYEQTSRRVYALVLRVVQNPAMSAEVVQEVYLQVWMLAHTYNAELGTPQNWIFTVAHRRAVDRVRSEQSAVGRDARYGLRAHALRDDTVDESVHRTLMSESVVRSMAALTARQAEAIRLAFYGGLTYAEVAETLKLKLPTVKSRIRSGLIRLRDALEADGYDAHAR